MSSDFHYYKSYGHDNLLIDFTLLTSEEVAFVQKHLTLLDSQSILDFAQSFRFSLSQLADKQFQRALYLLNKSIRAVKVHLGFPQLYFTNDNLDIAALNFVLKPSTHIYVFTNTPPKRDIDRIISEVNYYMNYRKYFQLYFWHNEEKELQTLSDTNKSKRKSKAPKSKFKSPKVKSKRKSKAKRKSKSKRKSKTKSKSKSKRKSKTKSKSKRKSKTKSKSPKRKSPKVKSKRKSKAKSKSPKRKSKAKS